jgi:hypothetical protein
MSMAAKIRRTQEGLARIPRETAPLPPGERYLVMCVAFFVACSLFVSGLAPFLLVLGVITACTIAESLLLLDEWLKLRQPVAEVFDISSAHALRWRR